MPRGMHPLPAGAHEDFGRAPALRVAFPAPRRHQRVVREQDDRVAEAMGTLLFERHRHKGPTVGREARRAGDRFIERAPPVGTDGDQFGGQQSAQPRGVAREPALPDVVTQGVYGLQVGRGDGGGNAGSGLRRERQWQREREDRTKAGQARTPQRGRRETNPRGAPCLALSVAVRGAGEPFTATPAPRVSARAASPSSAKVHGLSWAAVTFGPFCGIS
jgi:hypothetical protein